MGLNIVLKYLPCFLFNDESHEFEEATLFYLCICYAAGFCLKLAQIWYSEQEYYEIYKKKTNMAAVFLRKPEPYNYMAAVFLRKPEPYTFMAAV